jgi:hypothetical protein
MLVYLKFWTKSAVLNNYFIARLSIPCLCAQKEKTATIIITKDGVISLSTKGTGRVAIKSC